MSTRQSSIVTDKKRFLKKYQEILDKGYNDDTILDRTAEQYGSFYIQTEMAKASFDPGSGELNPIVAIAFNSEDDAKFCTLAYSKLQLSGPLHFRKGAMLIQGRGGDEPMPVMQSFIFTDKK